MRSERSPIDEDGRVVRFHPRGTPRWRWPIGNRPRNAPGDDLAKFERSDSDDDYPHRMRMNALALVATLLLVFAGVWLAIRISELANLQNCFLSGRHNCAPIEAGPTEHG